MRFILFLFNTLTALDEPMGPIFPKNDPLIQSGIDQAQIVHWRAKREKRNGYFQLKGTNVCVNNFVSVKQSA